MRGCPTHGARLPLNLSSDVLLAPLDLKVLLTTAKTLALQNAKQIQSNLHFTLALNLCKIAKDKDYVCSVNYIVFTGGGLGRLDVDGRCKREQMPRWTVLPAEGH